MSKSPTRSRARYYATAVAGFVISLVAICAAAPDAFATRLPPPEASGGSTTTVASHSGMAGWEIALIVIGAVIVVSLLVGLLLRGRRTLGGLQRAVS